MSPDAALDAYEAALTTRLLAEDGSRRVVLAGNSLGAYIAARLLSRVGASVSYCLTLAGLARLSSEMVRGRAAIADQLERGEVGVGDIVAALRQTAVGSGPIDSEVDRSLTDMLSSLTQERLAWGMRLTSPLDQTSRVVAPFAVPMTVMHGRDDAMVPFACSEELLPLGGTTRLAALETSAHVLPMSHADEVAQELRAILTAPNASRTTAA